jgi:exopolysaccharide biosynthesis polyprenyl glycosylphosphotransferase
MASAKLAPTPGYSAPNGSLGATYEKRPVPATSHSFRFRQSLFVAADLCGISSGGFLAIALRFPTIQSRFSIAEHVGIAVLYSVLIVLFCHTQRLYRVYQSSSFATEIAAIIKSVLMATVLLAGCLFVTGIKSTSRLIVLCTAVSALLTMTAWRSWRRRSLQKAVADGLYCHNVLIVGTDNLAQAVAEHLSQHRQFGFVVLGHVSDTTQPGQPVAAPPVSDGGDSNACPQPAMTILGPATELKTLCRTHFIDEILVCAHNRQTVMQVIADSRECGVGVRVIPDLYDGLAWGARLDYIGDFPSLAVVHRSTPALAMTMKRVLDVVGSAFALALLSPLLLLVALIVKLDSRGPVLYASKRLGKKARAFSCYKFRTMVTNADLLKDQLGHLNERDGVFFKITNDPRITRAGRFLRKHSLDELPQFWNVLRGDMSLVGPRPPLVNEVKNYQLEYLRRLEVAPGITGLWQVEARNHPSFDRCMELDVQYIENWSLGFDLHILYRTIAVVLAGTGS